MEELEVDEAEHDLVELEEGEHHLVVHVLDDLLGKGVGHDPGKGDA